MTDIAKLLHEIDGEGPHHFRRIQPEERTSLAVSLTATSRFYAVDDTTAAAATAEVGHNIHPNYTMICCCGALRSRWGKVEPSRRADIVAKRKRQRELEYD